MATDSLPVRVGPDAPYEGLSLFPILARWSADHLTQPDGPRAGEPWRFTTEQAVFLSWWYAFDEQGRWIIRRGTLRRMKGWGKDPLGAVLCAFEGFGPCRPARRRDGRWFGRPNRAAWVQIAAVSRDQTRTTMRLFPGLIPKATREKFRVDLHKEIVHIDGGRAVIEAITSSPLSAEGPRATFVLRNEVQNWIAANDGHEMAEVIDGNLAKSRDGSARALSLCNAHVPGQDSIGEREWDAWQAIAQGRSRATGVLYDALEAPPETDLKDETSLRTGLLAARGDSTWLDIDRLVAEVWDPRTPASEARRKYLNQVVAAEDSWVAPWQWDALADPALTLADGDQIALGFDGSKSIDHTALVAARIADGAWITLGVWDPERFGGEAPRDLIDGEVRRAFGAYDVVAFFADVREWESYIDRWELDLGGDLCVQASPRHRIAWDMRARNREFTIEGAQRVYDEIVEATFHHDANAITTQHVHNARRRPNGHGVSFGKEHRESQRKIDALAAGVLARMARIAYLNLPEGRQRRKRSGRAVFA